MKQLSAVLAFALLMASCNQFEKTKTGMPYKIKKGANSVPLKNGQFIKFNIEFKVGEKDSILNSSYGHIPAFMRYDSSQLGKYNFTEVLPKLGQGDELTFTLSIDSLKNMGMIPEFNKTFNKGGVIKGKVEIVTVYNDQNAVEAAYKKEVEDEKAREIKDLNAYAAAKGLKTQSTPNGALVVLETPGDLTNKADSGKEATVLYKGYTVDGKVFDSNMDKPGAPEFKVVIGERKVIQGWDEGLRFFGKGGKGKILVPAMLGYGQQGAGGDIKPFTNLVFDVQIANVGIPAPAPAKPATTPGMPPHDMPAHK
jgi:FKBP-type peptidyl-prolyl cis-trans isomerase